MTDTCEEQGCAACVLAEKTGRPHSDFEVDADDIPDFGVQEPAEQSDESAKK